MMRIVVILLLLVPVILLKDRVQDPSGDPVDIQIGEFSTTKFIAYDYKGPIPRRSNSNTADTRSRRLIYEEELRNRNSIENRSRDMLDLEESVMREARNSRAVDMFRYRVSVKNTGLKMIKAISWDFQGSYTEDFADTTHREFRCTAKLKPNQSERFEGHSILPPIRVISAANKTYVQRVVINRIEYDDGTFWQRSAWRAPQEASNQPARGNCQPL